MNNFKGRGWWFAVVALVVVSVLVTCAGCENSPGPTAPADGPQHRYATKHYDVPYQDVYTFNLEDGTPCAYLRKGNSLTCGWRSK